MSLMNMWPMHWGAFDAEKFRKLKSKGTVFVLVQLRGNKLMIEYLKDNQRRFCPRYCHYISVEDLTVSLPFSEGERSKKKYSRKLPMEITVRRQNKEIYKLHLMPIIKREKEFLFKKLTQSTRPTEQVTNVITGNCGYDCADNRMSSNLDSFNLLLEKFVANQLISPKDLDIILGRNIHRIVDSLFYLIITPIPKYTPLC